MMNILKDYKGKVSKLRNSKNFISRSFYSINKFCYVVFHIIIKSSYREQFISRTIFNKHFHQSNFGFQLLQMKIGPFVLVLVYFIVPDAEFFFLILLYIIDIHPGEVLLPPG